MWTNFFRDGGWGMVPTLVFGCMLVGLGAVTCFRPQRDGLLNLLCLVLLTMASGVLGTVMGLISTFRYLQSVEPNAQLQTMALGAAESLNNATFALMLCIAGGLLATVGIFRLPEAPFSQAQR